MPPPSLDCQERTVLEGRASADLKVYIRAVGRLADPLTEEEFDRVYENKERARTIYERSRDALKSHIATHRC